MDLEASYHTETGRVELDGAQVSARDEAAGVTSDEAAGSENQQASVNSMRSRKSDGVVGEEIAAILADKMKDAPLRL